MVFVRRSVSRRVNIAIGRADDQVAIRPKHATDFGNERFLPIEMLDRFERDDGIDAGIRQRQGPRVSLNKSQVRTGKIGGGAADSVRGIFHPHHRPCDLRQLRRSVSLAARDIQHIQSGAQGSGEQIAVVMFDLRLAVERRGQPLAGKRFWIGGGLALENIAHSVQPRPQRSGRGSHLGSGLPLRHQRQEALVAAQGGSDAVQPLVHRRGLAPEVGVIRGKA